MDKALALFITETLEPDVEIIEIIVTPFGVMAIRTRIWLDFGLETNDVLILV